MGPSLVPLGYFAPRKINGGVLKNQYPPWFFCTTELTSENPVNPLGFSAGAPPAFSFGTLVPRSLFRCCASRFSLRSDRSCASRFSLVYRRRCACTRLFSYPTKLINHNLNSKLRNHLLGLSLTRSERSSEQPTRTAAHSKVNFRPVGSLEPNSFFTWIGLAYYILPPTIRTSIDPLMGPPGSVPREPKASKSHQFHYQVWVWCTTAWLELAKMPVPHDPSSRL